MTERSPSVELAAIMAARSVVTTALRWFGPFLPTLQRAFGTTTGSITTVIGAAELGGLSTLATGRLLGHGRERRLFLLALSTICASSVVALGGSLATFAISFALLVVGAANFSIAGHAWIAHRFEFSRRGRAIGIYETSWAASLLIGAPVVALLVSRFGWRGPYVALALATGVSALVLHRFLSSTTNDDTPASPSGPLPRSAWPPMIAAAATTSTGIGMFVISGTWLDDTYGVSTVGLGLVAALFGAAEFLASCAVALISDRIGARTSAILGLGIACVGVALMTTAGGSRTLAIVGLVVFIGGFEYAIVAEVTLVTEAAPLARGRAIGLSSALGTVSRALTMAASGRLYEAFEVKGPLVLTATTSLIAMTVLAFIRNSPAPRGT